MVELAPPLEASKALIQLDAIAAGMPGKIRRLEMTPADLEIARGLDRDASNPEEGAINPEHLESKKVMSPEELKRWVTGDDHHDMQAFSLFERRFYGFGYASMDGKKGDPRYDPGFIRRVQYLQKNAGLKQKDVREYNFWADRSDSYFPEDNTQLRHETTVSWVAKHLLSLFKQHTQKEGNLNGLAFFMSVESDDLTIDGRILKELGFQTTEKTKGRDYDNPNRPGDDTLYVLTFDNFAKAMEALDKRMQTPPGVGEESKMFVGDDEDAIYYGEGKAG